MANLPPVSTTLAELVAKFAAGVIDTGGKLAEGVVDTRGNFAAGAHWLENISANFWNFFFNYPSVTFMGLGEDDPWKNLVKLSL
jgi:hypothetical protein